MSTAALIQRAQAAGVTLRLEDGQIRYIGSNRAVASLIEPLRQHKADLIRWFTQSPANDPEPKSDPSTWRELAAAYYAHHVNCRHCIAAGRAPVYGKRCSVGIALWHSYSG